MKLSVLAARIDPRRQIVQEPPVVRSARERAVQNPGVHARDDRLKLLVDKRLRQLCGVALPEWEDRPYADSAQPSLPLLTDVC